MILITGHQGFVGRHLTAELDSRNVNWIGYDLQSGDDIRDGFKLHTLFTQNRIDTIIHLAARAGVRTSEEYPDEYISTNIIGTQRLLECAKKFRVKHFIFFSSSSVYGSQNPPNREDQPMKPDSLYGITKATGEMMVAASGVPSTIIRPFTIYGENGRADQVFYKWLDTWRAGDDVPFFGDGSTKRGYTYVGDLIMGIVSILGKWSHVGAIHEIPWACEVFNLGGSEITSLEELKDIFAGELSSFGFARQALPKGDVKENWADITKARKFLGFNPQTIFKDKVRQIIKDYKIKHHL